jgi:transcriptional regulator with XRE-family HTH domain
MIKDQLTLLLTKLDANVGEIAECSNMNISSVSRIKSGARVPNQHSQTLSKLVDGILTYCEKHKKLELLDGIIGLDKDENAKPDIDYRKEVVISFLLHDSNVNSGSPTYSSFPNKMEAMMQLIGISNKKLAELTNIEASYLSRIKNGNRTPKQNAETYKIICHVLFNEIQNNNMVEKLKEYIPTNETTITFEIFKNWLCDSKRDDPNIVKLLSTIDKIEILDEFPYDVSKFDLSYTEKSIYRENSGLQDAVIRFLSETIKHGSKEVYLYSDRSIDWMTDDKSFSIKWSYLMMQLVSKGIKIKIIHNIDRKSSEMINAIQSWLPIYMSCCIEPFYTNLKKGGRFTHTLFISPGVACIYAMNINGNTPPAFNYFTDNEHISHCVEMFNGLLEKSIPIIQIEKYKPSENDVPNSGFSNICIKNDDVSVTISRLKEPKVSFLVLNHVLRDAVNAYIDNH